MLKILTTAIAIAIATLNAIPHPTPPTPPTTTTTVAATEQAACVTMPLTSDPGYSSGEGATTWTEGMNLAGDLDTWAFTGDWDGHTVHAAVVGTYLWYVFDATDLSDPNGVSSSVNVSGLESVTVCR